MVRVLVLGGTLFLGRHIVAAARGRGFDVTVFTRGRSGSVEVSDVEHLRGDRDGDVSALEGKRYVSSRPRACIAISPKAVRPNRQSRMNHCGMLASIQDRQFTVN